MFTISTTMIMNRVPMKDIPYDADKDFVIVSIMPAGSLPFVAAKRPAPRNLKEFVAYAKKTEKVNIGTYGAGSYAHMAIAEMNKQYGLKMEPVHYRGEAPMWTDLAGGSSTARSAATRRACPCCRAAGAVRSRSRASACRVARRSLVHGAGRDIAGSSG